MNDTLSQAGKFTNIGVLGAGSWGTALAALLSRHEPVGAAINTTLWGRQQALIDGINEGHENAKYLPLVPLPEDLTATTDLNFIKECDALVFVVPAQYARNVMRECADILGDRPMPVALCNKGIEQGTNLTMHELLGKVWADAIPAVLSGPSFARDVATHLPTAVTLACTDQLIGAKWMNSLSTQSFRPYLSQDLIGAELGGAVKNVLAIACGVVEGAGLGESAKAALMARGFAEFERLGMAIGAHPHTMAGLSGLGDLILTCGSRQSRNMSLGYEIGKGRDIDDILGERHTVSEGAATAAPLLEVARREKVDMPICAAVDALVAGRMNVKQVIKNLLSRPLKAEGV